MCILQQLLGGFVIWIICLFMFVYFDWYVKSPGGHNASLKYCTLFSNTLPETFMRLELKKIKKVLKKKKKTIMQ